MAWETDIADVIAGQPITSSWGNTIRDRVQHVVATEAALPAGVADGGLAYATTPGRLFFRTAGAWAAIGYRELRGVAAVTFAAADNATITVTFPVGFFSVAPVGVVSVMANNVNVYANFGTPTTANVVLRAVHRTAGSSISIPATIGYHFWQP